MCRNRFSALCVAVFMSAICGVFISTPANAQVDYPVFDRASVKAEIQQQTVHVFSSDETAYSAVKENKLTYLVRVRLSLTGGRLRRYTISPNGIMAPASDQDVTFRARGLTDVRETHAIDVPLTATSNVRNYLVAQCNNLMATGSDEMRRHETNAELPIKLTAVAGRRGDDGNRNRRIVEVTGSANVRVICEPIRRPRSAAITEVFLDVPQQVGKFCPQDVTLKA